ncbi:hypothetical protein Sme01_04210 [Sphaerisporangium melleum]|uniref:Uncharacterized protein n=1 Tax=Sphaerisporangium melleum TaxID=321316 RepID=A0A917QPQ3_9ACTN|nr:hypothetical protein [Sphaerisporangium melleum]GGK62262.1 hypothetical protein GCM10007964_01760 [Sphaerisporangium melleum]GII67945.1 hypothetical protein Sme01_04210 [Sphaerisporangium melleum]
MKNTVTQNEQATPPVVVEARQYADGWSRLAGFLEDHPEIAEGASVGSISSVMRYLSHHTEDPARFMVDASQACVDAGGRVEPDVDGRFAGVKLSFGPVRVFVYTDAHRVATHRVTGTVEKVEYTLTFDLPEQAAAVTR